MMMGKKLTDPCQWCGKPCSVRRGRKYCSQACYGLSERVALRQCPTCSKEFKPSRPEQTFCSQPCAQAVNRVEAVFTCPTCGKPITTNPSTAAKMTHCSVRCRQVARIQHDPERWCEVCGRQFTRKWYSNGVLESLEQFGNRLTCSDACGLELSRRNQGGLDGDASTPYRRNQDDSRTEARHHYEQWTGAEVEIIDRDDLTIREMAQMTGRTYAAVCGARRRLLRDPKWRVFISGTTP